MNETLGDLFNKCQQLSDKDFGALLSAMMREQKDRDCRAERAAWKRVTDAIECYVREYGPLAVVDGDVEIELWQGNYGIAGSGKIEVGA